LILPRRFERRQAYVVLAYVVASCVWIYGVYDRYPQPGTDVFLAAIAFLAAAHVAAGYVLGYRSGALVVVLLALSLAAGARDGDDDGFPVVGAALLYWLLPALILLALGVLARRAAGHGRARRSRARG
jgi:hypothetical protein